MKTNLRLVAVVAVALLSYAVLLKAFHWMSMPSDRALYAGIGLVLVLMVIVPVIVRTIWRKL